MTFTMKREHAGYGRSAAGGLAPLIISPQGQRPSRRALPAPKAAERPFSLRAQSGGWRSGAGSAPKASAPAAFRPAQAGKKRSGRGISRPLDALRKLFSLKPIIENAVLERPGRVAALSAALGGIALFLGLAAGIIVMSEKSFPRIEGAADPLGGLAGADLLALLDSARPELDPQDETGMVAPDISPALSVNEYVLRKGDTIDSIARRHGLSRDSIISMNGIKNAKYIMAGTSLKLPNQDGVLHRVGAGESLNAIAQRYKVEVNALLDANNLDSYVLKSGQNLFVPGGKLDRIQLREALGDLFAWPVRGRISSPFGYRIDPIAKVRRFHYGMDVAGALGTRINAAMEGRVVDTGYNANFGNYVIVSHAGGFQSAYAHLSAVSVQRGAAVVRGQKVGEMGSTGYSTGPHLHFSVYRNGKAVNPINFLVR